MARQVTSRELNQDASRVKRAAEEGPVVITDRGRPAHVLLTFAAYEDLVGARVIDRLGEPAGIESVDLAIPPFAEPARPATFD